MSLNMKKYNQIQNRTYELLARGSAKDLPSLIVDMFLFILILLNVTAVCLESVSFIREKYLSVFYYFEIISVIIFSIEYILRVWSAPSIKNKQSKTTSRKRLSYIFSFTGIIDLAAILPSILPIFFGGLDLRWLRVLRLLRLLKISNYSSALEDFFSAIKEEWQSFSAALYLILIALFLSSSLMYIAEHEAQPETFSSIPETMWWSLITLTTVGYGDVSPISPLGKIIGAFTAVMGVFSVALLTGIVANAFAHQVAQRKAILEAEIANALEDGEIDSEEQANIDNLRKRYDISEDHVKAIIEVLKDKSSSKK